MAEDKIVVPSNGADEAEECNKYSKDDESSVKVCDNCRLVSTASSSDVVNSQLEAEVLQSYKQKSWYQKFVIVLDSDDDNDDEDNDKDGNDDEDGNDEHDGGNDKECSDCDSGYNECDEENSKNSSKSKPDSLPSLTDPKELEALEELFKNTDWMGSGLKQSCEEEKK